MNRVNAQAKNLITSLSTTAWIFILILSIPPVLVGIVEAISTDWSKTNRLLGDLAPPLPSPWPGIISLSVASAVLLGMAGWLMMFIQTRTRFQAWSKPIQITIIGILTLLTIIILWIEITWIHLIILFSSYDGPLIGWPVTPNWIVTIGWIWTGGIIVFVATQFSKQFVRR